MFEFYPSHMFGVYSTDRIEKFGVYSLSLSFHTEKRPDISNNKNNDYDVADDDDVDDDGGGGAADGDDDDGGGDSGGDDDGGGDGGDDGDDDNEDGGGGLMYLQGRKINVYGNFAGRKPF